MRLDWLKIGSFKNLQGFEIDFDEGELSTVLIGENGTGKSNVIEALVTIFRDLDLEARTEFAYAIAYQCHGCRIEIDNALTGKNLLFRVDGETISRSDFNKKKSEYLPDNVFGYYSGASRRLEQLFDPHQARYYRRVISPESEKDDVEEIDLRRLFYCRSTYGQLALLTYFARGSDSARAFLKKHMQIKGFDSALLVLRKPRWAGSKPTKHQQEHGDPRFWYAAGLVRSLLEQLWEHSLAPINHQNREQDDYRTKPATEDQVYIFIRDEQTLRKIAKNFGGEKAFFALLETLDISDLIREVRIWVKREEVDGEIPFHEISDGEKQLLSVLGLMRFTGRDESLFLLDEPDTHLNPTWKWDYLPLVRTVAEGNRESHIIMSSHDPLTIASLRQSQVQILYADGEHGPIRAAQPSVDPKGLGVAGVLRQVFGMPTTLDPETQEMIDERNRLLRLSDQTEEIKAQLHSLNKKLDALGLAYQSRDPDYDRYLRVLHNVKKDKERTYTPDEIAEQDKFIREFIETQQ